MIATILLQAGVGGLGGFSSFVPLVLIIVVFYFFMIRPQVKKQKDQKKYVEELKKGDKVITTGGIYGKVQEVNEQTVTLEIDSNVHIKVDKSAVLKDPSDLVNQK